MWLEAEPGDPLAKVADPRNRVESEEESSD